MVAQASQLAAESKKQAGSLLYIKSPNTRKPIAGSRKPAALKK
jgi:hypothetical protein